MLKAAHHAPAVRHARAALAALTLAVIVVLAGPASPGWAHADLVSATPEDGASLAGPPASAVLTFSDPIAAGFVRVAVTTPAGPATVVPVTKGPSVTVPVPAHGPGAYRIVYRVVSADGHPVSGQLHFTVTGTPTASPSPAAAGSPSPTGPSGSASPSMSESVSPSVSGSPSPSGSPSGSLPASPVAEAEDGGDSTWLVLGAIVLAVAAGVGGLVLAVGRGRRP